MRIERRLLDEITRHALGEWPRECCGLVIAAGDTAVAVAPIRNASATPEITYEMAGAEQFAAMSLMAATGRTLGAIYHSHPRHPAVPSVEDVDRAYYPDALYLIVSLAEGQEPDVRAWEIREGTVLERRLEVT